jgi:hypothetical protein
VNFKVGDKVKVVRSLHPDVSILVNGSYYIEGIDTRGIGGVPCRIHLRDVTPWVLPEELAPPHVNYTKLAEIIYPDGHREGDRWILK